MAQKVQIILEDDLDGGEADETVSFALDGTSYEIDLNEDNATKLREALATYVGHARKVTGSRGRGRRRYAVDHRPGLDVRNAGRRRRLLRAGRSSLR